MTPAEASDLGQKSIEHLSRVWESCCVTQGRAVLYDERKAAALLNVFKKNHTWQCPTLNVLHAMAFLDVREFTADPRLKYMPPGIRVSLGLEAKASRESGPPAKLSAIQAAGTTLWLLNDVPS